MPEVLFTVQLLPRGETKQCYSPSTVVRDYFTAGEVMPVAEFVARSRRALSAASERVRARHGFTCGSAAAQLDEIERWTASSPPEATVRVLELF